MTDERYVVTRTIHATPHTVFALLSDPARHRDTEPGDWVRDAIDPRIITGTGQIFAMNMFFEQAGGPTSCTTWSMRSNRTAPSAGARVSSTMREIWPRVAGGGATTWRPTETAPTSRSPTTGRGTPQEFRDQVGGMPVFGVEFIDESLAALERSVT